MLGEPALQLGYRDQGPAPDPDDAKLGEDVVFEEVDADAERLGGLGLGEGEAWRRSPRRSLLALLCAHAASVAPLRPLVQAPYGVK